MEDKQMIELLRTRRSIRKYQKRSLDTETIELLKESILRSPSSRGIDPWEFIFIDDRSLIQHLSKAKTSGSDFLKDAVLAVVVTGDEKKSDVWIEDCSIASIVVQLAAHSLGLGSCWIQIRNRNHNDTISSERYIQNLFRIPEHIKVLSVIGIGFPDELKTLIPQEKLKFSKIHHNGF
jgi:nitroreductase